MNRLILCLALIIIAVSFLNASYNCNDFEKVFPSPPGESTATIKRPMVEGATYFFQSYGAANYLLAEGEASDNGFFDLNSSSSYLNEAISKLEISRDKYNEAYQLASALNYIDLRITQLKSFDYSKYATENNLNLEIMDQVSKILSKGDVRGFYKKNIDNVEKILDTLYVIKSDLLKGQKPTTKTYWGLIRQYSDALLFGNYATAAAQEAFNN